jgi:hypothetical protein
MKPKRKRIRAHRDTPEAAVEENARPYEHIGQTEEEIREEEQGELHQEPGPRPGSVPTDGS